MALSLMICSSAANECVEISQSQARRSAAVIFQGVVEKVDHMTLVDMTDPVTGKHVKVPPKYDDYTVVTFRVSKGWKGPVSPAMKLLSVLPGPGYRFEEGKRYIVYAADDLNQDWSELQAFSEGLHVYNTGGCRLRVSADIERESSRLGMGRAAKGHAN